MIGLYALGDASALGMAFSLLAPARAALSPALTVLLVTAVIAAVALARLVLGEAQIDPAARTVLLVGLFVVIAAFTLSRASAGVFAFAIAIGGAFILWARGLALAEEGFDIAGVRTRLWLGLPLTAVTALVSAQTGLMVIFVVTTLIALQLALLRAVADHQDIDPRALRRPGWWRTLGLVELGALTLMALTLLAFNVESITRVAQLLVFILMLPLVVIVGLAGGLFLMFISPEALADFMRRMEAFLANLSISGNTNPLLPETSPAAAPSPIVSSAITIGIAVAALALVVLFALGAQVAQARRARAARTADAGMPEALPASEPVEPAGVAAGLRRAISRRLAAATIRLIYARMAAEAARRGEARRPAQTPSEYVPALERAFPGAGAEAGRITAAYIAAHYGELPDTLQSLRDIQASWSRLRQTAPPAPEANPTNA